MIRYKTFRWKHLPTGERGKTLFDRFHVQQLLRVCGSDDRTWCLSTDRGLVEVDALRLVNYWNRTSYNDKHNFVYWLDEIS